MGATAAEPGGAMLPAPFRVVRRAQDTADTWTLELEPVSGAGPSIAPGQFMMVYAFGIGEVPISVSGPPARPGPVVLTVRSVGAVTAAICGAATGQTLGLRGPFGEPWPVDDARGGDVVVVAGGIGLAPLRPVVLTVLAGRGDYGTVNVLYGARSPEDLLYTDLFDEWRRVLDLGVTVDTAGVGWSGRVGVVTKLVTEARFRPERTSAFVCGPEIMMRFVRSSSAACRQGGSSSPWSGTWTAASGSAATASLARR
jgi:NAD(P)H-flavin reductase